MLLTYMFKNIHGAELSATSHGPLVFDGSHGSLQEFDRNYVAIEREDYGVFGGPCDFHVRQR